MSRLTVVFVLLLFFFIPASAQIKQEHDSSKPTKFWGVEEMGFMAIEIGNQPAEGKLIVTAKIDSIAVSDTTNFFGELISNGKKVGNVVSVYGVDMCLRYYKQAKVKHALPLGPKNLQEFGEKAEWTFRKLAEKKKK